MSTKVAVTIMLTLPWALLGELPAYVNDYKRLSVISSVRTPPTFSLVESEMKIPHLVDQIDSHSQEVNDMQTTHPIDNRYSEIYKYDHSSIHAESLEPKKNDSSNVQYSTHDEIDNNLEKIENLTEENKWTTKQAFISKAISSDISKSIGDIYRPAFTVGVLNSSSKLSKNRLTTSNKQLFSGLNHYFAPSIGDYYATGPLLLPNGEMSTLVSSTDAQPASQPAVQPQVPNTNMNLQEPIIITSESPNILNEQISTPSSQQQMVMSNVNWQRVGILLALIQLGIVKLKAAGFIKTLLFFLFKFKLFLILVFLKFISFFNMLLFYKLIVLPLLLLPLFPITLTLISPTSMVGLLSIPRNIINMALSPAYLGNITPASTSSNEVISYTSPLTSTPVSRKISIMPRSTTKTLSLFKTLPTNHSDST